MRITLQEVLMFFGIVIICVVILGVSFQLLFAVDFDKEVEILMDNQIYILISWFSGIILYFIGSLIESIVHPHRNK